MPTQNAIVNATMRNEPPSGGRATTAGKSQYYQAAQAWDVDRLRYALVSRNRAYLLAAISVVAALILAISMAYMAPLKTVDIAVFSYDERTGALRQVRLDSDIEKITGDEAFIRSQIYQFIMAYESWDMADASPRYKWLSMVLTPSLLQTFDKEFDRRDPAAQINTLGDKGRRTVKITNIAFLNTTTLHVQFSTATTLEQSPATVQDWAAVVQFGFTKRPKEGEAVYLNPFGFQITSYRRDAMVR